MPIWGEGRAMLRIDRLSAGYDRLEVLHELSFEVATRQAVAVLGANGAGKTTLCRTISGLVAVRSGSVHFGGADISQATPDARVRSGIVQVPEGRQVFPEMTVIENLRLGAYVHGEPSAEELERVYGLFPVLKDRRKQRAGLLSGGEQQMLALGRALMGRPRLLLLDEPSQGLSPKAIDLVAEAVREIAGTGVSVLLVEQNLALAAMVAQYAYVLETGACVAQGPITEILSGKTVQESYLGH